jgi:MFS family permease
MVPSQFRPPSDEAPVAGAPVTGRGPAGDGAVAGRRRVPAWLQAGWLAQRGTDAGRSRWLLILVAAGVFNSANDQTSIVTVLPTLITDIGLTIDQFYRSSWVVNGYLLGYLVALPIVGRIADVFGHARIFAATLVVFMIGSALVALAPSFEWIVAARALQAFGGGGVVPVAMAIVVTELPPSRRLIGLGAIAAATEAGALIGPAWGGTITQWFGWRWVFWSNLPLVAPTLIGAWWLATDARPGGRIDWRGAALLGAALAVLTYALVDDPVTPRPWFNTLALLAAAAALGAAFVFHERRLELGAAEPMVRLSAFAQRPVAAANLSMLLVGAGLITALVGVPLFVNIVLVETALDGGLTLMRLTVAVPLGALAGGWLGGRLGLRQTAFAGCLLVAVGFAGLQAWDRDLTQFMRTVPQLVGGFGFGLVLAPLSAAVLQRVGEGERATAAAWHGHEIAYLEPRLVPATAPAGRRPQRRLPLRQRRPRPRGADDPRDHGVELLALRSAGFNHVDVEAAAELGITVARVPAYSPHAVAEHAVALILALNRKLHRAYNRVREGNFSLEGLLGFDLHGRTVGVIGTGRSACSSAASCAASAARCWATTRTRTRPAEGVAHLRRARRAARPQPDIVSLHSRSRRRPATSSTRRLDRARCAPGVMLINTSRGGLVDTAP